MDAYELSVAVLTRDIDLAVENGIDAGGEAIVQALRGFANSFDIADFLARHLELSFNASPSVDVSDANYVPVINTETYSVGVVPVPVSLENLYLTSRYTALVVYGGVSASLYEFPEGHPLDVFSPDVRLVHRGVTDIPDGGYFSFDGSRFACDYQGSESAIAIRFDSKPRSEVTWVFERNRLSPIASIPSDRGVPHKLALISLLGKIGDEESKKLLIASASDANHHVRWAATSALFELDPRRAIDLIAVMVDDPHYHVRTAAKKVMNQVELSNGISY